MFKRFALLFAALTAVSVLAGSVTGLRVHKAEQALLEKTVKIDCKRGNEASFGSGAFISAAGHILTADHVVKGCDDLKVTLYNSDAVLSPLVLAENAESDLAILKVVRRGNPYFTRGEMPAVGDRVRVVGHPLGLGWSITDGHISRQFSDRLFQVDAAINPGNSGGPVVDKNGYLIGIAEALYSPFHMFCGYGLVTDLDQIDSVLNQFDGLGDFSND